MKPANKSISTISIMKLPVTSDNSRIRSVRRITVKIVPPIISTLEIFLDVIPTSRDVIPTSRDVIPTSRCYSYI